MVDVVVGQDHPVDLTQGVLFDESNHRPKAARVAGIDDGDPFVAAVHERVCAANARNRPDHTLIIGLAAGMEALLGQGLRSAGLSGQAVGHRATVIVPFMWS